MQLFLFDSVTTSVVVETIIGLSKETFEDARDAEDAMCKLDRVRFYGRELEVEFARGDRKSESEIAFYAYKKSFNCHCTCCVFAYV